MKLLVCGSRHEPTSSRYVIAVLADLMSEYGPPLPGEHHVLIHGAAPGVDTIAGTFGVGSDDVVVRSYPADWDKHGRAAGPIRNQQMLDEEHWGLSGLAPASADRIDLVLAFPDPESRGTWDMVERAVRARIPVRVYPIEVTR